MSTARYTTQQLKAMTRNAVKSLKQNTTYKIINDIEQTYIELFYKDNHFIKLLAWLYQHSKQKKQKNNS